MSDNSSIWSPVFLLTYFPLFKNTISACAKQCLYKIVRENNLRPRITSARDDLCFVLLGTGFTSNVGLPQSNFKRWREALWPGLGIPIWFWFTPPRCKPLEFQCKAKGIHQERPPPHPPPISTHGGSWTLTFIPLTPRGWDKHAQPVSCPLRNQQTHPEEKVASILSLRYLLNPVPVILHRLGSHLILSGRFVVVVVQLF